MTANSKAAGKTTATDINDSLYVIKDRAAVPKEEGRELGGTKAYNSAARYQDIWGETDYINQTEETRIERNKHVDKAAEAYYDFITDHYQGGWGRRFHFCGYFPGESFDVAQARHEHHLALSLQLKPGMKVLDAGCGVGAPAREIARFVGCHVTGVTINDLHVERSNKYNKQEGLQDQVHMVKGTFTDLPFPDESFDAVYSTEAICYATDMGKACQEIYRVLKPGGRVGFLEWVITDKYDNDNPAHRKIRSEIERGSAVARLLTVKGHADALTDAGFTLEHNYDRATDKSNPIGWWTTLNGQYYKGMTWSDRFTTFALTKPIYNLQWYVLKFFDLLGQCHPARMHALETVAMCVYGCRDGGREGIFSPMHCFIGVKPEKKE